MLHTSQPLWGLQHASVLELGVQIWWQHPATTVTYYTKALAHVSTPRGQSAALHLPFLSNLWPTEMPACQSLVAGVSLSFEFSDKFMFGHVFKGCLSLYALFRVSKPPKTAFLFGCSSVTHRSDEQNGWHAAGVKPKATPPPTPHTRAPKITPNKGHLHLLGLKSQVQMRVNH